MKKKILALLTTLFVCSSVGVLASCKDDDSSSSSTPPSSEQQETFAELTDFTLGFGDVRELSANGENLVWSTSNPLVATVNENGEVFGCGLGETTITVTDGVRVASCKVTVIQSNNVPTPAFSTSTRVVILGQTHTLTPKIAVSGVEIKDVTFTYESADTSIATVDNNGVVTAVALGETKIYVSYSAGGYSDTIEIPVTISEDIVIELNCLNATLAIVEVDGGEYSAQAEVEVTRLLLNGEPVDFSEVTFAVADESIASFDNGVLTSKKIGETKLLATYQTENSSKVVEVPVSVVRDTFPVVGQANIDVTWDEPSLSPVDYAYIELPYSVQIAEEDVLTITDRMGKVLSENAGLTVPKTAIKDSQTLINIATETLVYKLNLKRDSSCIQLTNADYAAQFTDATGVRATALNQEMDGRTNVLKTVTPNREKNEDGSTTAHVWYTHCGYLNFGKLEKSWEKGIFIYDVKAEEGTYLGGYVWNSIFTLNTETMKFSLPSNIMKIVDENFEETTFKYGEWNTVVVDYTQVTSAPQFLPSFTGGDLSVHQEAYYSNMRYMTKDAYEKLKDSSYEERYTVSFETGYEDITIPSQEVGYREKVEMPTMDDEYALIGWLVGDDFVDLENLYVTSDVTLSAVYDKNYQYTVYYLQRQINGSYKIVEEDTFVGEGKMLTDVTAEIKTYEGYTLNETLSVTKGKVLAFDKLALAIYYENDNYTFETQAFGRLDNRGATITKESMTGVPATDLHPNTYKMTSTVSDWYEAFVFTYTEDKIGSYLVMNVYFTSRAGTGGFVVWDGPVTKTYPIYSYDINGEYLANNDVASLLNKWINVVIQIPEGITTNQLRITFSQYAKDTWYMGEYTYLTEEQFKANFRWAETDVPTGTTRYAGSTLTAFSNGNNALSGGINGTKLYTSKTSHFSTCTIKPNGVTSWTAGQYVAITVKSYTMTGQALGMYNGTLVGIYDEAGNAVEATAVQANKWYTYLFNIPNEVANISLYVGSIQVKTETTEGYKFLFESVYSIADDTALESFKTWKGWNA